jgi:serine O-acetyltransferase
MTYKPDNDKRNVGPLSCMANLRTLCHSLREDSKLNSFRSTIVLAFYRISQFFWRKGNKRIAKISNRVFEIIRIILNINCSISYKAVLGNRIRLLHVGEGVVVSSKAIIGNNVTIYHQVTIGINESGPIDKRGITIGNNCYLSCGCKIISCEVGEGSVIGPNAVVYKDIRPFTKVFAQQTMTDN